MKLVKSLLLGSAAGLVAVAGAQAADLPSRKAAPAADYVRICSAYGAAFYYIPGTETCLRVGGRVRAEYRVVSRTSTDTQTYGFRARARLNIDARTQTAYGVLRTFFRLQAVSQTSGYAGVGLNDSHDNSSILDLGFIQFAGITAGKATSFFDMYAYAVNYALLRGTQGDNIPLLAYTATFGGGFSATIALEDGTVRARYSGLAGAAGTTGRLGREYPDVVANLRVAQGWGWAQLSGAIHQVRGGIGNFAGTRYDKTGFAIGAGAGINLPMLAPGSILHLEGVYAEGAISYLGVGTSAGPERQGFNGFRPSPFAGGVVGIGTGDAYVNAAGQVRLAKGFSLLANLTHYWTPSFRQNIFGSYLNLDYRGRGFGAADSAFSRADEYRIGTALIWSPTSGFDIGVEVLYTNIEYRGFVANQGVVLAGLPAGTRFKFTEDAWEGRLRLQREF